MNKNNGYTKVSTIIPIPNLVPVLPDELQYSHLLRTTMTNGFASVRGFLATLVSQGEKMWFRRLDYDCNKAGCDLGFKLASGDYILETSLIKGIGPLRSRGALDHYVRAFNLRSDRSDRFGSAVEEIRRCRECWKEDTEAYGMPYIHRSHVMSGVSVCSRHCCALERYIGAFGKELLENATYVPCEVLPDAEKVSAFCSDLLKADLQCSLQDIAEAVRRVVSDRYGLSLTGRKAKEKLNEECQGVGNAISKLAKPFVTVAPAPLVSGLAHLFGNVSSMAAYLAAPSLRTDFERNMDGFRLVGPYRDDYVTVRCLTCGSTVRTTPHSMITGLGCPICTSGLTDTELLERQIRYVRDNVRILSPIRGACLPVILDTGDGPFRTTPDRFINDLKAISIRPESMTDMKLSNEVGEGFKYLGSMTVKGQKRLRIRHVECGQEFEVFRTNWRLNRSCRCCQVVRSAKAVIPSTGKHDREADRIVIDQRISSLKGSVMFLSDFHDITDKRYVRNYINRVRSDGKLKSIGMGIFCASDETYTAMQIADAKYVERHGKRFGVHVGNTFLKDIGFDLEDEVPCIVTSRSFTQQWTREIELASRRFKLMYSPVPINVRNWKVLTLLLFYFRLDACRLEVDEGLATAAIRKWADENGLSTDDFKPYKDFFPVAVISAISNVVRRIS